MPRLYPSIRAYRKAHHITQKMLALQLRVSQSALSLYELGKRSPRARVLLRIHDTTGVPIETLLRRRRVA